MMDIKRDLEKLLRGLTVYDDAQEPPGKDGDPQIATLLQFLQGQARALTSDDIILDVGSGRGILAHILIKAWPQDAGRPCYYAVDQEPALEQLALPIQIHNHSMKLPLPDLAGLPDGPVAQRIKIVVVRNVFHHLHIADTAAMFLLLRALVRKGSTIYIQDMTSLPTIERRNAGWPADVFQQLAMSFGFAVPAPFDLKSHSGIPWFALTLNDEPSAAAPNRNEATHLVLEGRREQLRRALEEQAGLTEADETAVTYLALSEQIAVLNGQIHAFEAGDGIARPGPSVAGVELRPLADGGEYAEELRSVRPGASGLKGILSSKNLIDLPVLIETATSRLWFAGYSQRLLFTPGPVREALARAAERGVEIRVLIVDPNSDAARARGQSHAYSRPDQLASDIDETIHAYRGFADEMQAGATIEGSKPVELRLSDTIISSSFFFVDMTCICSLYSFNLRGGSAPAFVLRGSPGSSHDYFTLLLREFQSSWLKASAEAA
jgi:hypothetical protein